MNSMSFIPLHTFATKYGGEAFALDNATPQATVLGSQAQELLISEVQPPENFGPVGQLLAASQSLRCGIYRHPVIPKKIES